MLHIVYGSSVSDKTERLYDEVIRMAEMHPEENYIYIVPEQASLMVQKALIDRHPKHALFNIDVQTFSRLTYRVFDDMNVSEKEILSETGKRMLMRLVFERKSEDLTVLKRNIRKPGFPDEMKSVISELSEYNVTPEMLIAKAESLTKYPLLSAKLKDIGILYEAFLSLLHEHYEMAEERLLKLRDVLPCWTRLSGTTFIFDGFTGFTPLQYEVTRGMIRYAKAVIANVTVGRDEKLSEKRGKEALFYMGSHMAALLMEQAIEESVPYDETQVKDEKDISPEIRFIEKQLFAYPKKVCNNHNSNIQLLKCRSRKEETAAALHEVLQAVREGLCYREIAVIAGDPEGYREEIEAAFTAAGIPFFIDVKRSLDNDPSIALIRNALSVLDSNYSFESVIGFVKNPIILSYLEKTVPESSLSVYEALSLAENIAFSKNLRGRTRWQNFGDPCIEAALSPLFVLQDTWKHGTVSERVSGLRTLLLTYDYTVILEALSEEVYQSGDVAGAKVISRTPELIDDIFDELDTILGNVKMSSELFIDVLTEGLSSLKMGQVPPTLDRLVVGDLMRTRLSGIRKLIIIGANDGCLPQTKAEGGLLSDLDREILSSNDLTLSETAKEAGFNAQFYLYLLLTLPSESIFMTASDSDSEGKPSLPAYVFNFLRGMFPKSLLSRDKFRFINTPADARAMIASGLREYYRTGYADSELRALFLWYREKQENAAALDTLAKAIYYTYKEEMLSEDVIRRMFNETMTGSVTRLERFAECAFKHFLTYGLKLKERKSGEVEAVDYGSLFHSAIETFFKKTEERGKLFSELSDEERSELISESVSEVTEEYGDHLLDDTNRNAYIAKRVERIAKRTVDTLAAQWEKGAFTDTRAEVSFLFDGFEGRIDRIDTVEKDEQMYVKIIDYKSGDRDIDYTKVYYGLELQLLLYLEAAKDILKRKYPGRKIIPAGVYYYHIDDPLAEASRTDNDAAVNDTIGKSLSMKGITNADQAAARLVDRDLNAGVVKSLSLKKTGDEFNAKANVADAETLDALGMYTLNKAKALKEEIRSGRIPVKPYAYGDMSGCTYCEYCGICGFDRQVKGFSEKRLYEKTLDDFRNGGE